MTAPVEVRASSEFPTLADRLTRLSKHVQAVADAGGVDAGFAAGILGQLAPAVADAAVQADQSGMYRAEAGDREHAREGLQSARRDLQNLADLARGLKPGALSKQWLIERLTASIRRLDESLKPKVGD